MSKRQSFFFRNPSCLWLNTTLRGDFNRFVYFLQKIMTQSREKQIMVKVRLIHAERPFGNLDIGISASASALTSASASALQKICFVLRSLYFCFSKFYMKKTSMVKYFSSILADLPSNFRRCLEQLFCRKPVSAWFWRKQLHSRRYLRSFKNTHGRFVNFAGL